MTEHPLVGVWKLVSMERIDLEGNVTQTEVLTGLLTYSADGWMTEALEYRVPGSDESPSYVFYAGRYEIDDQTVIHQPRIHTNHQLVWTDMPRSYEMSGNRFTLTARNPNGAAYLIWERVLV